MEVEITPTANDLLSVISILWQENDSLRERIAGASVHFASRTFSRRSLENGLAGISVYTSPDGSLVVAQSEG